MNISTKDIKEFLQDYQSQYIDLLNNVKKLADSQKSVLGPSVIYRIYSRSEFQDSEFKDAKKIWQKFNRIKLSGRNINIKDINDIIGVTIVSYYESDNEIIFQSLKNKCHSYNLKLVKYDDGKERHIFSTQGYYAHHFMLTSDNINAMGLRCEVQIKTILHDGLHAKMHDTIYKPFGEIREGHDKLMMVISESIQAIEIQTDTFRTLITQNWEQEEELRKSVRMEIVTWLENKKFKEKNIEQKYKALLTTISKNKDRIANSDINSKLIVSIINRIEKLSKYNKGINAAWLLMVFLCCINSNESMKLIAKDYLSKYMKNENDQVIQCWNVSLAYYLMGDRTEAINEIEKLISTQPLASDNLNILKFNLLYFLTEEASYHSRQHRKSLSAPDDFDELKNKSSIIFEELKMELEDPFGDSINVSDRAHYQAQKQGTLGYYYIIFGETREKIKEGVRICTNTLSTLSQHDTVAKQYLELHEQIGWRRLLNMKIQ